MAFGRKMKGSAEEEGSRRNRYGEEDDLFYEDEEPRRRPVRRQEAGYGVGDSYRRQEEYGRLEDSYPYDGRGRDSRSGEPYGYGDRSGRAPADPYAAGPRRREDPEGRYGSGRPQRQNAAGREGYGRPGERWQSDPYDDRYEGTYDGFEDDAWHGERAAYGSRGSRKASAGGTERRQTSERRSREAAGRDVRKRQAKRKKSRKGSFILKVVLLVIAAILLFVVYRFSRMDRVRLGSLLTNEGAQSGTGYENFVIYGVDSREGELTKDSHSDTIVICSINKSTKEAKMVSVYRDTYLDNTNGEYRKATECYFFGGPERSINMLNKNLDLDIKDYIAVNFNAVIKAVDLIGGVDINVTEEELPYINGYQTENAQVTGAEITPVESAGYQHLNGIQALAYCRIRYTAGSDFKRTERQRDVLMQIFENAKKQGSTKMLQIADAMMPYISTSFSNTEIISLVSGMADLTVGDSTGFPFEQQPADIAAGDCVVPVNLAANVSELHAFLFGQNDYTPSQTVQQISQQIVNDTGIG